MNVKFSKNSGVGAGLGTNESSVETSPTGKTATGNDVRLPPTKAGNEMLGTANYGGVTLNGREMGPADLSQAIGRYSQLAVAYAEAGRPRLAEKRLDQAREALSALKSIGPKDEIAPHPALAKSKGDPVVIGELSVAKAASVVKTAAVVPPEGPPTWKKTVVLFGSSMNPPTGSGGHAGIVDWAGTRLKVDVPNDEAPEASREGVGIDEVWVLPVHKHIFSSKSNLIDFDHRVNMADLAFSDIPGLEGRVKVKDTERSVREAAMKAATANGQPLSSVSIGTVDIVEHLQAQHPDVQFVLALGGDTYQDLTAGKWKKGDELLETLPIVVVPRKGVNGVEGTEDNAPELSDISSTTIRSSNDLDLLGSPEVLHPKVLEYMREHKLYAFGEQED